MLKLSERYSAFDLMQITLMAALGLAVKPIIVPLTHMITGPLFIPGGAVAGGFYMMWLVLAGSLVGKRGASFLTALVQGLIVLATGSFGTHGIASIITYTLPGLAIELIWLITRSYGRTFPAAFLAGTAANLSGTFLSNLLFFRLPLLPLLLSLSSAGLSGGFGGLLAYRLYQKVKGSRNDQQHLPDAADLSGRESEE